MAGNVLSLAVKIAGDASQVRLTPLERALESLQKQTERTAEVFGKLGDDSAQAAAASTKFREDAAKLTEALTAGTIGSREYAKQFGELAEAAKAEAAAIAEAARITKENQTNLDVFTQTQARLAAQMEAGRISVETYDRALEKAAKGLTDAERASVGLAVKTAEAGNAAGKSAVKFNELSGIAGLLPGRIGAIASRISAFASAGEGLGKIFSGGLKPSLSGLSSQFAAIATPANLAAAGIVAVGTAAVAVTSGLIALEDRIEKLTRLADQFGVSLNFAQVLEEAGKRTDVSVQTLQGSVARLQRTLTSAGEGSDAAAKALDKLGVSLEQFNSLTNEEQILLLGERIAAIEDPATRSAAAMELFGKSGVQLLPFFNEINNAANDIDRFGRSISQAEQKDLAGFGSAMDRIGTAMTGLGNALLVPFTRFATGIANAIAEIIAGVTAVANVIGTVLEPVLATIGAAIGNTVALFSDVARAIGSFIGPFVSGAAEILGFQQEAVEKTEQAVNRTAGAVRELTDEQKKAIDAAQSVLDKTLEAIETEQKYNGDSGRFRAAQDLLTIENEIKRVNADLEAARKVGDTEAINAGITRLAQLDQASAYQDDIASGAKKQREEAAKAAEDAAKVQKKLQEDARKQIDAGQKEAQRAADSAFKAIQKKFEDAIKAQQKRVEELNKVDEQIAERRADFNEALIAREGELFAELSKTRSGAVQINDLRSGGLSSFFDTLNEDPVLAEQRKSRQELEKIQKGIDKLAADRVEILQGIG